MLTDKVKCKVNEAITILNKSADIPPYQEFRQEWRYTASQYIESERIVLDFILDFVFIHNQCKEVRMNARLEKKMDDLLQKQAKISPLLGNKLNIDELKKIYDSAKQKSVARTQAKIAKRKAMIYQGVEDNSETLADIQKTVNELEALKIKLSEMVNSVSENLSGDDADVAILLHGKNVFISDFMKNIQREAKLYKYNPTGKVSLLAENEVGEILNLAEFDYLIRRHRSGFLSDPENEAL